MKATFKIYALLMALALMACGCSSYDKGYYDDRYYYTSREFLTLRNFSSDTTIWFIPEKDCAENLPAELTEWQKISIYEIGPHSAYTLTFDSEDNYVTPVETYGVSDLMAVYVFKKSVWESNSWSDLVSGKMWSGKCSCSVDEVVAQNGILTYPIR